MFTKRVAICSESVSPSHREPHCVPFSLECHLTAEPVSFVVSMNAATCLFSLPSPFALERTS